jgi:hypothetical protein
MIFLPLTPLDAAILPADIIFDAFRLIIFFH